MTAQSEDPDPGAETSIERQARVAHSNAARAAEDQFRALYRDLVPRLAAFLVMAYQASRRQAAECAHEALVAYWRRQQNSHHEQIREPLAWCRKAARSAFMDRRFDASESFIEFPATGAPLYAAAQADAAADQAQRDVLLPLIADLPPRQSEILALVTEGLSHAEIAVELDLDEATVRSHIRHARERLAELYRATRGEGDSE